MIFSVYLNKCDYMLIDIDKLQPDKNDDCASNSHGHVNNIMTQVSLIQWAKLT